MTSVIGKNRTLSIVLSAMITLLCMTGNLTFVNAYDNEVNGGSVISTGGTYNIADGATGVIRIATTADVTLVGHNISESQNGTITVGNPYTDLTIDCDPGVNLTIQNVYISNNQAYDTTKPNVVAGSHVINFNQASDAVNTLTIENINLLETMKYVQSAGLHVACGNNLTLQGTGKLYMYKYSQGAGIGGSANEGNGDINISLDENTGYLFIKGSKTGPLIGNDTCANLAADTSIGDITISSGNINLVNKAQGAAIGGSRMSCAGDVYLEGGNVAITTDFSGSAIGAGAQKKNISGANGNLYITGGSLKTMITSNAASSWGVTVPSGSPYIINNSTVTATTYGVNGTSPVRTYLAQVPASSFNDNGSYNVAVNLYGSATQSDVVYDGIIDSYEYTANTSSTVANWIRTNPTDETFYFYLPAGTHTLTGNGVTQTVTVTAS